MSKLDVGQKSENHCSKNQNRKSEISQKFDNLSTIHSGALSLIEACYKSNTIIKYVYKTQRKIYSTYQLKMH